MDDFYPGLHGKLTELLLPHKHLHPLRVGRDPVFEHPVCDVEQPLLGKVRDQAGVCTVVDNTGGRVLPAFREFQKVHLPVVQGLLVRACGEPFGIGVPDLNRRVHVQDAVVVAPLKDRAAVDVPGKVNQQPAGLKVIGEDLAEVFRSDFPLEKPQPPRCPRLELLCLVLEIDDRDILERYIHVL